MWKSLRQKIEIEKLFLFAFAKQQSRHRANNAQLFNKQWAIP